MLLITLNIFLLLMTDFREKDSVLFIQSMTMYRVSAEPVPGSGLVVVIETK